MTSGGYEINMVKFSRSLVFSAVIGIGFKSGLLLEEIMDAKRYVHGVPADTSRAVLEWLEESVDIIVD
jgi:hypothetical protein